MLGSFSEALIKVQVSYIQRLSGRHRRRCLSLDTNGPLITRAKTTTTDRRIVNLLSKPPIVEYNDSVGAWSTRYKFKRFKRSNVIGL
jgi:hypothetical protein